MVPEKSEKLHKLKNLKKNFLHFAKFWPRYKYFLKFKKSKVLQVWNVGKLKYLCAIFKKLKNLNKQKTKKSTFAYIAQERSVHTNSVSFNIQLGS